MDFAVSEIKSRSIEYLLGYEWDYPDRSGKMERKKNNSPF